MLQDQNRDLRLERVAATNKFPSVLSEKVHAQLGSRIGSRPLGSFPIKGLEGEHPLFGC